MNQSNDILSKRFPFLKYQGQWKVVGTLPVLGFIALALILYIQGSALVIESPMFLALLNTIFVCAIPLAGAYLAARSFRATGVIAFLWVGCGLLFFGVSSLAAGWVMPQMGGQNANMTLHNLGSLFAGLCLFMGAHFFIHEMAGKVVLRARIPHTWLIYACVTAIITFTGVLALRGSLPQFFNSQTGPSSLRQLVLGASIFLFGISGWAFVETYFVTNSVFAAWFGLALWLITIGLTCVMLQRSMGSPLGWVGRGAQYLGCVYLLIAFYRGRSESRAEGSPSQPGVPWSMWPFLEQHIEDRTFELVQDNTALQKEISERKLAEAFLTAIIEKSPISMWISDEKGTLVRANQACRDQLHVTDAELVGKYNIFEDNLVAAHKFLPKVRDVFERGLVARFTLEYNTSQLTSLKLAQFSRTFLDVTISPVLGADGKVCNAIIQHLDISERMCAELAIRENEERLSEIMATLAEGVALNEIVFDADGEMVDYKILQVNDFYYDLVELSREVPVIGNLATQLYGMDQKTIKHFWNRHKNVSQTQHAEFASPITGRIYSVATSPLRTTAF